MNMEPTSQIPISTGRGIRIGQWARAWRRFRKNKAAIIGLLIVGFIGFLAAFDRLVAPFPPNCSVGIPAGPCPSFLSRAPPSAAHLMGTDLGGQDVYSQTIYGARAAFFVGLGATAITIALATLVGLVAGYYGGQVDNVLMRLTEVFLVLPFLLVLLVFLQALHTVNPSASGGLLVIILIIGAFSWPGSARIIRGEALHVREFEYIAASREIGATGKRILFRHLLPNILHVIIVLTTLQIAASILIEAAVSFLGFGDQNTITWGQQLSQASQAVHQAWWAGVFPGLFLTVLVLGFNLLGNGLRDALDPGLRD